MLYDRKSSKGGQKLLTRSIQQGTYDKEADFKVHQITSQITTLPKNNASAKQLCAFIALLMYTNTCNRITSHESPQGTRHEHDSFSCVSFCLWSLRSFERCALLQEKQLFAINQSMVINHQIEVCVTGLQCIDLSGFFQGWQYWWSGLRVSYPMCVLDSKFLFSI